MNDRERMAQAKAAAEDAMVVAKESALRLAGQDREIARDVVIQAEFRVLRDLVLNNGENGTVLYQMRLRDYWDRVRAEIEG